MKVDTRHFLFSLVTLGTVTICSMVSCSKGQTKGTTSAANLMSENQSRQNLNLRTIKPGWHLYRAEFEAEDWKVSPAATYLCKRVQRDQNRKILWEEDYYYTGKTFITAKGQDWEMLSVHYDYGPSLLTVNYVGRDPVIVKLIESLSGAPSLKEKLSVVDKILSRWKMPRL